MNVNVNNLFRWIFRIPSLLVVSLFILEVSGKRTGSPICGHKPGHGVKLEKGGIGFDMSTSLDAYIAGESMGITLSGTEKFKGFFVSVYDSDENHVGVFEGLENHDLAKASVCDIPDVASTHRSNNMKDEIALSWKPNSYGTGNVTLKATVVIDASRFDIVTKILTQNILNAPPLPLVSPKVYHLSPNSISIKWIPGPNKGPTVTKYVVTCIEGVTNTTINSVNISADKLIYTITGLNSGTTYEVSVQAINSVGISGFGNSITQQTPTVDASLPEFSASNLIVLESVSSSSISVSWTLADCGIYPCTYTVQYQKSGSGDFISIPAVNNPALTTFLVKGLEAATPYTFRVEAQNLLGTVTTNTEETLTQVLNQCESGCGDYGKCIKGECICANTHSGSRCQVPMSQEQCYRTTDPYCISWGIDGEFLQIRLRANTNGWLGVILNPRDGKMSNGEAYIAWVDDIGEPHIEVRTSLNQAMPIMKANQDEVSIISGTATGGQTDIVFKRPLISSNLAVEFTETTGPIPISWAYSETGFDEFTYHGILNRGFDIEIDFYADFITTKDTSVTFMLVHDVLMLIGYGVFAPVEILLAAFYKTRLYTNNFNNECDKPFKITRLSCQVLTLVCVLSAGLIMIITGCEIFTYTVLREFILSCLLTTQICLEIAGYNKCFKDAILNKIYRNSGKLLIVFGCLIQVPMWNLILNHKLGDIFYVTWYFYLTILLASYVHIAVRHWQKSNPMVLETETNYTKFAIALNSWMRNLFHHYGVLVATHPCKIIAISLALTLFLGAGLINMQIVTSGIVETFIPVDAQAKHDGKFVTSNFPNLVGDVTAFIVKTKDGSNIIETDKMINLLRIQRHIESMEVQFMDPITGVDTGETVILEDVCLSEFNIAGCKINSPLSWWEGNAYKLSTDVDMIHTIQQNATDNMLLMNLQFDKYFGGLQFDDEGELTKATALRWKYTVISDTSKSVQWQKAVRTFLLEWPDDIFDISVFTTEGAKEELNRVMLGDLPYFGFSIICMIIFAVVTVGRPDPILSGIGIGIAGAFNCILAIIAGFGFSCYFGFIFTSLHGVIPFIIFGIGLDDMFIIASAANNDIHNSNDKNVISIISRTMSHVGPAITMTSMTDFVAFMTGTISSIPVVRSFCFYAGACVLFDYFLQITFFIAIYTFDVKRRIDGRVDMLPCMKVINNAYHPTRSTYIKNPMEGVSSGGMNNLQHLNAINDDVDVYRSIFDKTIARKPVKICIVITFSVFAVIMAYFAFRIEIGQDTTNIYKDDSFILKYKHTDNTFYPFSEGTTVVITKELDYHNEDIQAMYSALERDYNALQFTNPKWADIGDLFSWYNNFVEWTINNYPEHIRLNTDYNVNVLVESEFYPLLGEFLRAPVTGSYHLKFLKLDQSNNFCFQGDEFNCKIIGALLVGKFPISGIGKDDKDFVSSGLAVVNNYPLEASVWSFEHTIVALSDYVVSALFETVGCALISVALIGSLTLVRPTAVIITTMIILIIDIEAVGVMQLCGIKLDAISLISLVMSIGLTFDYVSHMIHSYMLQNKTDPNDRLFQTFVEMAPNILRGGASTLLGILFLSGAGSAAFRSLFVVFSSVIVFSIMYGILFIPAIMTLFPYMFKPVHGLVDEETMMPVISKLPSTTETPMNNGNKLSLSDAVIKCSPDFIEEDSKVTRDGGDNYIVAVDMKPCQVVVSSKERTQIVKEDNGSRSLMLVLCRICHYGLLLLIALLFVIIQVNPKSVVTFDKTLTPEKIAVREMKLDFSYDFNITMGNFPIPKSRTSYMCKGSKFPTESAKHFIKSTPIIDTTHIVHHIIIYQCSEPIPEEWFDCNPMPSSCVNILAVWAIGGGNVELPPEAGAKIGRGTDTIYIVLQVHYDNYLEEEGLIDNSGLSLSLTEKLRQHDAGVLITGSRLESIVLPPKSSNEHLVTTCPPTRTQQCPFCNDNHLVDFFGEEQESITIYSVLHHSHTHGKYLWANKFDKHGVFIENISSDMTFDKNSQQFINLDQPIQLSRGESIKTHCVFDTQNSDDIVYGGDATYEEMCLIFMMYYPKVVSVNTKPSLQWCVDYATYSEFPDNHTPNIL